jgi:hypothetical protein
MDRYIHAPPPPSQLPLCGTHRGIHGLVTPADTCAALRIVVCLPVAAAVSASGETAQLAALPPPPPPRWPSSLGGTRTRGERPGRAASTPARQPALMLLGLVTSLFAAPCRVCMRITRSPDAPMLPMLAGCATQPSSSSSSSAAVLCAPSWVYARQRLLHMCWQESSPLLAVLLAVLLARSPWPPHLAAGWCAWPRARTRSGLRPAATTTRCDSGAARPARSFSAVSNAERSRAEGAEGAREGARERGRGAGQEASLSLSLSSPLCIDGQPMPAAWPLLASLPCRWLLLQDHRPLLEQLLALPRHLRREPGDHLGLDTAVPRTLVHPPPPCAVPGDHLGLRRPQRPGRLDAHLLRRPAWWRRGLRPRFPAGPAGLEPERHPSRGRRGAPGCRGHRR